MTIARGINRFLLLTGILLGIGLIPVASWAQITQLPGTHDITVDGLFTTAQEWSDVTPILSNDGQSLMYMAVVAGNNALYVMLDEPGSTRAFRSMDLSGPVEFNVGEPPPGTGHHYSVFFNGSGIICLRDGRFFNVTGIMEAARNFGQSPNSATSHNMLELKIAFDSSDPSQFFESGPGSLQTAAALTYNGSDLQLANFESGEKWSGTSSLNTVDFRQGSAGRKITAAVNDKQYIYREILVDAGAVPWDMTFWVYTTTPTTIGRLSVYVRSGPSTANDYTLWAQSGFQTGWNQVVIPSDAFVKHEGFVNNFSWSGARTFAFKLEANGNGSAVVTLDDLRLQPPSAQDRRRPVVWKINVGDVASDHVDVSWVTSENATGVLRCGTTANYSQTTPATELLTSQHVTVTNLSPGTRYHCRIDATDQAGLVGSSGDFILATAPAIPLVPPNPTADYQQMLWTVNSLSDLAGLRGTPFTTYHSLAFTRCQVDMNERQVFLDMALADGKKVMMGLFCNPIDFSVSLNIVRTFKNHPAVEGWFVMDEPEIQGRSQAEMQAIYDAVKAEDPIHPAYIDFSSLSAANSYSGSYDKMLTWKFPIPSSSVSSIIPSLNALQTSGQDWGFVYQAWQWDYDRWLLNGNGVTRYPTAAEMRAMPFLAINHGAKSIGAFGYNHLNVAPGSEWKWSELLVLNQELARLRPFISSNTPTTVGVTAGSSDLDKSIHRYQDKEYVIAVNSSTSTVNSYLTLTNYAGTSVQDVEDGRIVPITSGRINDTWAPLEVQVYAITPQGIDTTAPTVSFTTPQPDALVGASTTITVQATDNIQMDRVQLKLDNGPLGDPLLTAPYTMQWNSSGTTAGLHALTAEAYDAAGNLSTTSITVTVDNILPTVSIGSPAAGSYFTGQPVLVTAAAADDRAVTSLQFKLDGVNLGAALTTEPYEFTWNTSTAIAGSHALSAIADDAAGNSATALAVNVIVDFVSPTLSIISPVDNGFVTNTVLIQATASDDAGVAGVQFVLDGVDLGAEDTVAPYQVSWTTEGATEDVHILTAIGRDGVGRTTASAPVQVTVDNQDPPATTEVRDGTGPDIDATKVTTQLTANWDAMTESGSGINRYEMAIGTTVGGTNTMAFTNVGLATSYTKTGLSLTNGTTYYVTIRTVDQVGRISATRSSDGIKIDLTGPTASITAPSANTQVRGTITISANASDANGIASVQFRVDGINIGNADSTFPYSVDWNTTTISNGNHNLTAIATDNAGNAVTSSKVKVSVRN